MPWVKPSLLEIFFYFSSNPTFCLFVRNNTMLIHSVNIEYSVQSDLLINRGLIGGCLLDLLLVEAHTLHTGGEPATPTPTH